MGICFDVLLDVRLGVCLGVCLYLCLSRVDLFLVAFLLPEVLATAP
jgi:hypothetical protein